MARALNAYEREQAMGYPSDWTRDLRIKGRAIEVTCCHVIGDGFHVPSVLLCLTPLLDCTMPSVGIATDIGRITSRHPPCLFEPPPAVATEWSARFVPGPYFSRPPHGSVVFDATSVLEDVLKMCPHSFFPKRKLKVCTARMGRIKWERLLHGCEWQRRHLMADQTQGPDIDAIRDRSDL